MKISHLKELTKKLKYNFKDHKLLELALTHKSFSNKNNERLEFFGDAILSFFISEILFNTFPSLPEGRLTQLRSMVVRRKELNEVGSKLNLAKFIRLGPSEVTVNNSIQGNTLEALVGAIYLDGGYKQCSKVIKELFKKKIENLDPNEDMRDSKTKLQEYIQQKGYKLPQYTLENSKTPKTKKIFKVICEIKELEISERGQGKNIKEAEMTSAERTLTKILRQDEGE